jgi:hypothetical protein
MVSADRVRRGSVTLMPTFLPSGEGAPARCPGRTSGGCRNGAGCFQGCRGGFGVNEGTTVGTKLFRNRLSVNHPDELSL